LDKGTTALIGGNGSGKTAFLYAISRLFGVTPGQRRIQKSDFHIEPEVRELATGATLEIDVLFSFPELNVAEGEPVGAAVPEFFLQMAASAPSEPLKARMVLRATWTEDGTPSGNIGEDVRWVRALADEFDWDEDTSKVSPIERASIQLVYVPAVRNVEEQVTSLLKGRLWQAARWSQAFRDLTATATNEMQEGFQSEGPASHLLSKLRTRWQQVHQADTDTTPILRLVDKRFDDFVGKAGFAFFPDEAGQERPLSELSDGQRSLFHIALTAATLEAERDVFLQPPEDSAFDQEKLRRAHLTLLAIEEPENSLSPFFLSRIMAQAREIGALPTAQVIVSSHSAAILSRIEPEEIRYFRLEQQSRLSQVRKLALPLGDPEAQQYVRLAVKSYPELYFARFVILAEGDSEQLVLPKLAEAMGVPLDRSFVPVVPLGGRYVGHFWRLLRDLQIPYATLLDFDIGRAHGGANMIRSIVGQLAEHGNNLDANSFVRNRRINPSRVAALTDRAIWREYGENHWVKALEEEGVFLSDPLDLDFAMLDAFSEAYERPHPGGRGPREGRGALAQAKKATVKEGGSARIYGNQYDDRFLWYPYLFLRSSKPDTHLAALARISKADLATRAPASLRTLIEHVRRRLELPVRGA
jgi:ABC-type cobalamin/Fe3+-siderophores transport system ATPase subunit